MHQNLIFPVQPDPVSGMHCWHQKVRLEKGRPDDRYGDIEVDIEKSMEVYWRLKKMAFSDPGPLRRPLWLGRPVRPAPGTFFFEGGGDGREHGKP